VLLDVVYNHFGPDGHYMPLYAPIFAERHRTPWGDAVNFDGDGSATVRRLVVENALYWLEEFNFDGLRLDAVHAVRDDGPEHILSELARRLRQACGGRHLHLVLENDDNQASRLGRGSDGAPRRFTAQWNDDLHHALHAAASGETSGYYADYAGGAEKLGRALAEGFAFQGERSAYRGRPRGEPSAGLPPTAFVSFIQNHDQIGNRAFGERLTAICPPEAVRAVAAVYLIAPQIPMLFMGEECGAVQPFPYFCDFSGELAAAVRDGRRAEFAKFREFQDPAQLQGIPDPTARGTFLSAKLDWEAAERGAHAEWLSFYRGLLSLRQAEIVPRLAGIRGNSGRYEIVGAKLVRVSWTLGDGSTLRLAANLSAAPQAGSVLAGGRVMLSLGVVADEQFGPWRFGPWSVVWSLEDAG
jgi:maltooligosyltrehalose trehalohydrolase